MTFTKRQLQIIRLSERGMTNEQIADKLCLSLKGVDYHVGKLYRALGVNNRADAIKRYREVGA